MRRPLLGRHEKSRFDIVPDGLRSRITSDGHDLICRADAVIKCRDPHAKRIVSAEMLPDERFVDDADLPGVGTIVRRDVTPSQDGDPEGRKEPGAHPIERGVVIADG
jgi:hypothetical protein